jgi:hypothetical protein
VTNTIPRARALSPSAMAVARRRRAASDALDRLVEWAEACDAAARQVLYEYVETNANPQPEHYVRAAEAASAAATAWAAVHHATRPNGAKD